MTTQPTADPIDAFPAFSAGHFVVLAAFAVATAVACAAGVRWRSSPVLRRAEQASGAIMLLLWTVATVYWLHPANFHIKVSLPIHMCDLTGFLAPLVLLTGWRTPRTLLYFWGLGLSICGILTPILDHGPRHITFWLYWLVHTAILGTAVYDVVARGYRPRWRDCVGAIGACTVWLAVVLGVNLSLDVNYGYVGNITPDRPTVIDGLGPWPLRVYKMIVAVIVLFVAMWLPWAIAGRRARLKGRTASECTPLSSTADR